MARVVALRLAKKLLKEKKGTKKKEKGRAEKRKPGVRRRRADRLHRLPRGDEKESERVTGLDALRFAFARLMGGEVWEALGGWYAARPFSERGDTGPGVRQRMDAASRIADAPDALREVWAYSFTTGLWRRPRPCGATSRSLAHGSIWSFKSWTSG